MAPQSAPIRPDLSLRSEARLTSWKEIAQFFDRDVRTVKRWEKSRRLPVHRLPGVRGGVYAFVHELQEWQQHPELEDLLDDTDPDENDDTEEVRRPVLTLVPAGTRVILEPEAHRLHPPEAGEPQYTDGMAAPAFVDDPAVPAIAAPSAEHLRPAGPAFAGWKLAIPLAAVLLLLIGGVTFWRYARKASGLRHTPGAEARELYLKGRYYWDKRTADDLNTALQYFQQAIAKDPRYGAAYSSLADTYYLTREFGTMSDREAFPAAIAAAKKAMELEPGLADAHRSYAFGSFYWTWDRPLAEQEFRKAIALDSNDALTHHWFANILSENHQFADAEAEMDRARDLQPTSKALLADRALLFFSTGREKEGLEVLQNMEKDDPSFIAPHRYLADHDLYRHQNAAFVAERLQIAQDTHASADTQIAEAVTDGWKSRNEKDMYNALADVEANLYRQHQVSAFDVAVAEGRAGRDEEALRYLELSYANHDSEFLLAKYPTEFDGFRNTPEFQELVRRSQMPYADISAGAATDGRALPPH